MISIQNRVNDLIDILSGMNLVDFVHSTHGFNIEVALCECLGENSVDVGLFMLESDVQNICYPFDP